MRMAKPVSMRFAAALAVMGAAGSEVPVALHEPSKTFDGIGAVSAGGTTRLLVDYEPQVRDEVLDMLFKPNAGAELQMLKVEMGGDTFTGCGTEPSHQRSADESAQERGYELWLAAEARKRNPDIVLLGLSWGFPAWVGSGALNDNQVAYTLSWLRYAQETRGITFDWIGIVNESPWSPEYVKSLRVALDVSNFTSVKIVAADNFDFSAPTLYEQLQNDTEFRNAVAAVGIHYPTASKLYAPLAEMPLPLWSSEDDSTNDDDIGAGCLARIINWNYIVGNYSSTMIWSPVNSWLDGLHWVGDGLIDANLPWSGQYAARLPLWITSHTTRFAKPGWQLLKVGQGAGMLPGGGSHVTYVDSQGPDWTMVVETMSYDLSKCVRSNPDPYDVAASQEVSFNFGSAAATVNVHVWRTTFNSGGEPLVLEQLPDLFVDSSGVLTVTFERDSVTTLTTVNGPVQTPSQLQPATPPASLHFPMPHEDDFESPNIVGLPRYFSDMCGSFAIQPRPDGQGSCFKQEVLHSPSKNHTGWYDQDTLQPLTVIGEQTMRDVSVRVSVLIATPDASTRYSVAVRAGGQLGDAGCGTDTESGKERNCVEAYANTWYDFGYFLHFDGTGAWSLLAGNETLKHSKADVTKNTVGWHELGLSVAGSRLEGSIDGQTIFSVVDHEHRWGSGWAALGSGWHEAWFDDFAMESNGPVVSLV